MSDWTMQPRNEIENKLHAEGYRVLQGGNCQYGVHAPNGVLLYVDRRSVDNCWTACYQHSKKHNVDVDLFTFAFTAGMEYADLISTPDNIDAAITKAIAVWKEVHSE